MDANFNMGGHNDAVDSIKIEYDAFHIAENPDNILSVCEGDCDNDSDCNGDCFVGNVVIINMVHRDVQIL